MCVVGAGVIGLTCALRLTEAGHSVHIVAAEPGTESVSAVAAAMWFPYRAYPQQRVLAWSMASLGVFEQLAAVAGTGVTVRNGVQLHREAEQDLWWTQGLPNVSALGRADLPPHLAANPAFVGGLGVHLPIIVMSRYLGWLAGRCADVGVRTTTESLTSVGGADPSADAVVLAVGMGARTLIGDGEVTPIRGQVVRVSNPGLTDWLLDEDDPDQFCYVIPRFDDVVCGGTAEVGESAMQPDATTEAVLLGRARALVPELNDARIVSRAVGLRPGRTEVRLERCDELDPAGRPVVACYGHGGAGVTMSWGCAGEVVGLLAE